MPDINFQGLVMLAMMALPLIALDRPGSLAASGLMTVLVAYVDFCNRRNQRSVQPTAFLHPECGGSFCYIPMWLFAGTLAVSVGGCLAWEQLARLFH